MLADSPYVTDDNVLDIGNHREPNPDWIFVLDRDAPISGETDKVPAQDVVDNSPALQNTMAVLEGQIVYRNILVFN